MSRALKDFDAFWAEQAKEPIRLRVLGEVEELPPSLPLAVMLRAQRIIASMAANEPLPEAEMFALAIDMFGRERVERWAAKGMTIEQMMDVFRYVQAIYSGQEPDKDGGAPGNAQRPPQAAPLTSFGTGL